MIVVKLYNHLNNILIKKHAYSSNHISLWTTCNIRSPIQIFVSILCWIQIRVHWSRCWDIWDNLIPVFICIFFGWNGTSLGISFLQNRRFSQQASWFREGTCHLCVRNDIRCLPPDFIYRGNIELYECPVKFWNYFGFVWPFYTLIEFLDF